jgi:hypothetical protein
MKAILKDPNAPLPIAIVRKLNVEDLNLGVVER